MLIFDIVSGQKFSNTKIGKWLKYFSKEDVQMTNKHMKWCLTAEKFKFKPLWDTTQYSLGWLLSKTKQNKLANIGEDMEKWGPWCLAGKNIKWCSHSILWKIVWQFLNKLKHRISISSNNSPKIESRDSTSYLQYS